MEALGTGSDCIPEESAVFAQPDLGLPVIRKYRGYNSIECF